MSDTSQGPDWWLASDGKWYPPQNATPPAPPTAPAPPAPPGAPAAPAAAGSTTPTEAIVGLVLGILSIIVCCYGVGIVLGGVGLFMSNTAKKKIAASNGTMGGAGLAQAGFITSIIGIALSVIGLVLIIVSFATGNGSYSFSTN